MPGLVLAARTGVLALVLAMLSCTASPDSRSAPRGWSEAAGIAAAQVPGWSRDDLEFFLHGSMGTEPRRAQAFTPFQADRFNKFLAQLEIPGYQPSSVPGLRSTQRYWAPSLAGVWARAPYLHNGSVRTMGELLTPPSARARSFRRGSDRYDTGQMGFADAGPYVLDTRSPGNGNGGHDYGTDLSATQKRDLIEFLKTR